MRDMGKYLFSGLATVAFCSSANMIGAATSADIYGRIPARNLFGLHDPVIVQPPTVEPPLPKIVLTGTTTILGNKMAFVKVQFPQKPGGQPQAEESFILAEGQREGDIEVLQIDEKAGSVRVKNSGKEMTVAFDKDAGKVPGGPGMPPPGASPNMTGGRAMNPGVSGYQRMIPTRTGRQIPVVDPPLPPDAQTPAPVQGQAVSSEKPLTPEEQAILKELEQAAQPKAPR